MFRVYHWKMLYLKLFEYENKCKLKLKEMAVQVKMIWIYHWKMFTSYCISTTVYTEKGGSSAAI